MITVYTDGKQFDDVRGAYCRLHSNGQEFCRFNLSLNRDGVSNGNIMANLKRQPGGAWSLKARGYYTRDTKYYE